VDPFAPQPARRHQTPAEAAQARVEAAAAAWRSARERTRDWPAHLRTAALQECADGWGGEPGTAAAASTRQAEAMMAAVPRTSEVERGPVDRSTAELARRLLAGTSSPEAEEAGRLGMRPPQGCGDTGR
jgi:hypothetical protein